MLKTDDKEDLAYSFDFKEIILYFNQFNFTMNHIQILHDNIFRYKKQT